MPRLRDIAAVSVAEVESGLRGGLSTDLLAGRFPVDASTEGNPRTYPSLTLGVDESGRIASKVSGKLGQRLSRSAHGVVTPQR